MEKIWGKSAGSELMGNQGQEFSSQNAFEGDMEKEPCKRNHAKKVFLCACSQIFQPEMKERNFENKYLKETKKNGLQREHWQQCWTDVFLLSG